MAIVKKREDMEKTEGFLKYRLPDPTLFLIWWEWEGLRCASLAVAQVIVRTPGEPAWALLTSVAG